jgi:hypothetical protein
VIRTFAVIALFVSLNVSLAIRGLELVLATGGGFIAKDGGIRFSYPRCDGASGYLPADTLATGSLSV